MDVRDAIAKEVEKLPPHRQEQVLRFVESLTVSTQAGRRGSSLRHFASSLDPISARQMTLAIEEECERVDTGEW